MLTPAIDAYGLWPVALVLVVLVAAVALAVVDGVRYARRSTRRALAIQRHPSTGRHRAAVQNLADAPTQQFPIIRPRPHAL